MPTSLPQEVKTNKVQTLPDDLKSIAEEMLAAKFGVKEEAPKKAKSFPGRDGWTVPDLNDIFIEPDVGNGRLDRREPTIQVKHQPWNGSRVAEIEVSYPDERSLIEAFKALDRQIGRRDGRKIFIGRLFYREIMNRDIRFARLFRQMSAWEPEEGVEREFGEIYGFPVIMIGNNRYDRDCYVQQEF